MWLIVGLGNPGDKYLKNRHNIGFMAADEIAGAYGFPAPKSKFQGEASDGKISDTKALLLKPQTYMNESGQAVQKAASFYKIPPENIIVLYDELDLAPGKVRAKFGGGLAGHNGLRSIKAHLGTDAFWRIRLGIGHPGDKDRVSPYVLSDFSKTEQQWLPDLLKSVATHIPLVLAGEDELFMTRVAADTKT